MENRWTLRRRAPQAFSLRLPSSTSSSFAVLWQGDFLLSDYQGRPEVAVTQRSMRVRGPNNASEAVILCDGSYRSLQRVKEQRAKLTLGASCGREQIETAGGVRLQAMFSVPGVHFGIRVLRKDRRIRTKAHGCMAGSPPPNNPPRNLRL